MKKLITLISIPILLIKKFVYRLKTDRSNLPGKRFADYGYCLGRKLLYKGRVIPQLLLNPVSIVRYFEYEYVENNYDKEEVQKKILDISSPYLFGIYIADKYKPEYTYINPDKRELEALGKMIPKTSLKGLYSFETGDATALKYADNSFDSLISISVIEHIGGEGDSEAISEMLRIVKPGGKIILTFPAAGNYTEEFLDENTYQLDTEQKEGKFFFQRVYDKSAVENRLIAPIKDKVEIVSTSVFGEKKKGFYDSYIERWKKKGLIETIKDAYYISKYFKYFNDINDLPGQGVCGITLRKK